MEMEEDKYWELLINFRWPHEGFSLGYDIFQADEENDFVTFNLYLGFITFIIHWN